MTAMDSKTRTIIDGLIASYNAEVETVTNYLAASVNIDGVRGKEIKDVLAAEVQDELGHAQKLAKRINTLGGTVPGSMALSMTQKTLQPPSESTDLRSVIQGVIDAEQSAIEGYQKLIKECEGVDYATQDLAISLLADEQEHLRTFVGFMKEIDKRG